MKKWFPAIVLCFVFVMSCGPARERRAESSAPTRESAVEYAALSDTVSASVPSDQASAISSSAAVEKGSDTSRRFIRTAELKFRVPDVIKATYKVEDIIRLNGGFVAYSNLTSDLNYEDNKSVTADSTLIITHFTINNTMTLRVPNILLDTTLKQIAPLIEFLDYRIINAKDVALDILTNRLAQIRAQKHDQRLSKVVDNKDSKGADVTSAAESLLNSQEAADQALISNLTLKDQIQFSTISIQMYQRQSVKYSLVANEKNIRAYEPGFFARLWNAVQTGFDYLKDFIIFLFSIWWFILLIVAFVLLYPRLRKRKPPVK